MHEHLGNVLDYAIAPVLRIAARPCRGKSGPDSTIHGRGGAMYARPSSSSGRPSLYGCSLRQHHEHRALRCLQRRTAGSEVSPFNPRDRIPRNLHSEQPPLRRTTAPNLGGVALPACRQRHAVKRLRCVSRTHLTPRLLPSPTVSLHSANRKGRLEKSGPIVGERK